MNRNIYHKYEDYNTYLIASRKLLSYLGFRLSFFNNGDNVCNYLFEIPIIMDENIKSKKIILKEGDRSDL